jgi:hypothetical protein
MSWICAVGDVEEDAAFRYSHGMTDLDDNDPQGKYLVDLLVQETDRGCALVGGQLVDDALGNLLLACMGDTKAAKDGLLMGGMAPLGSFSARQKVARHLGFVSEDEDADVEEIRWVRNKAAHIIGTHDKPWNKLFENEDVALRCGRFRYFAGAGDDETSRMRYTIVAAALASRFDLEAQYLRSLDVAPGKRVIRAVESAIGRHHHAVPREGAPPDPTTWIVKNG